MMVKLSRSTILYNLLIVFVLIHQFNIVKSVSYNQQMTTDRSSMLGQTMNMDVGLLSDVKTKNFDNLRSHNRTANSSSEENSNTSTSTPDDIAKINSTIVTDTLSLGRPITTQSIKNKIIDEEVSSACDLESIKKMIKDYISSGQLPTEITVCLLDERLKQKETIEKINRTLVEEGFPHIPTCKVISDATGNLARKVDCPNKCDIGFNIIDPSNMKEVSKLEEVGLTSPGTSKTVLEKQLLLEKLKEKLLQTAVAKKVFPSNCFENENMKNSTGMKIDRKQLIESGYFSNETLENFFCGEISRKRIVAECGRHRDLTLSRLSVVIHKLIQDGTISDENENSILSGCHNKTEIIDLLFQDNDLLKSWLPQKIQNMLQERPVPAELKLYLLNGRNKTEILTKVESNDTLLQKFMTPSSYFFYNLLKTKRNKIINAVVGVLLTPVLVTVMMALGCKMTLSQIMNHAKKPKGVLIALFGQFVMMPAFSFGLTRAFSLPAYASLVVLFCGCSPGGQVSNMLALLIRGDMNLSILMTTCSSVLGLGLMPLSIFIYARFIIPVNTGDVIPFAKIVINLIMTIIPVSIGMVIRRYRPTWITVVNKIAAIFAPVGFLTSMILSLVLFKDAFAKFFPFSVIPCSAILPMFGYSFGYLLSRIARENPQCRRTIALETGCQNAVLCATILKLSFDPIVIGALLLVPFSYMFFQVMEALSFILMCRLYDRYCKNPKEDRDIEKKLDINEGRSDKTDDESQSFLKTASDSRTAPV